MPGKKYQTEEQRLEARRDSQRKYRELHREQISAQKKEYYQTHREERLAHIRQRRVLLGLHTFSPSYETLKPEDELDPSDKSSISDRVSADMSQDFDLEFWERFEAMFEGRDIPEEQLRKAFAIARSSSSANKKRGDAFEQTIQRNLLRAFNGSDYKLYAQVQKNDGSRRIDFVVSKEVCEDKSDLDLSQAVIVSAKTKLNTSWREDQELYSQCVAYFMVTLDTRMPTDTIPQNVYFCSPNIDKSQELDHRIHLDQLADSIKTALESHQ